MFKKRNYIAVLLTTVFIFAANSSFCANQDLNDLEKMPKALPMPAQEEYKPLPTPQPQDPIKDIQAKDKYRFPKQNIQDFNRQPIMIDPQSQDKAILMNQKRWRQMMESDKADLFKRFDEWLEEFNIPKEYHLFVELFITALFILFFGIVFYRRTVRKQHEDQSPGYKQEQ
ncbi:MAG: hypothetical protein PHG69_01095 [Candidatus Omnitrophica bacterium]|nr:hypothetical protein [Candidatus Omnitrophota bacterium]